MLNQQLIMIEMILDISDKPLFQVNKTCKMKVHVHVLPVYIQ
jgi:hypothetical protein